MSFLTEALADSPTSLFLFDETSGTTLVDNQGVNNGTLAGSPTLGVAGLAQGTAIQFASASSQEATLPGPTPVATSDYSIEIWFKWTAGTSLLRDNTSTGGYIIGYDSSGFFSIRLGNNSVATSLNTSVVRDGLRHHVVVVKSGTTATCYCDGIVIATWTISAPTSITTPWHVMRNGLGGAFSDGVVDAIGFYPSALSQARILAHFNAGINVFGFLGGAHTQGTFQSSGTSISANIPKVNVGDTLIAIVQNRAYCNPTPPAGWTAIDTDPGSGPVTRLYKRVADGTEAASYAWTTIASDRAGLVISRLVNLNATTPFVSYGKATGTTSSVDVPSLTPTQAGQMLIAIGGANATTAQTLTFPGTMTKEYNAGNGSAMSTAIAQEVQSGTSATGTRTITGSSSTAMFGASLLLAPVVTGTTQTGTLSLSAKGTLTLTPFVEHRASITLGGSGTLNVTAVREQHGSLSLGGIGALSLAATREQRGALSLLGRGSFGLSPRVERNAAINLHSAGSFSANALVERHGAMSLGAIGTFHLSGSRTTTGVIALSAQSVMNLAAIAERYGILALSSRGTFQASANLEYNVPLAFAASSSFSLNAELAIDIAVEHLIALVSTEKNLRLANQDGSIFYPIVPEELIVQNEVLTLRQVDNVVKLASVHSPRAILIDDYDINSSGPSIQTISTDETQITVIPVE